MAVGGSKLSKNSVLIQYIRNPPTRVGANLREALRPRIGNQSMRNYYYIYIYKFQIIKTRGCRLVIF